MACQPRIKTGGLLRYKARTSPIRGDSSRRNACYQLRVIYFWALCLFSPLCKLSYTESCSKTLMWWEGCCTVPATVVKCCCRVVLPKSLLLLSTESLTAEGLTSEMTELYVATGEEAGTALWEHIRNQEQKQHEPQGVRNDVIVAPGDEQRTRTLPTATWRNSIFQGAASLLGLGLVPPKALETRAAKGA